MSEIVLLIFLKAKLSKLKSIDRIKLSNRNQDTKLSKDTIII